MKMIFEKWWDKGNKTIQLIYYKDSWYKPHFWIHENGARKKNGDKCFDFNINFFYWHFSYTNFNL